MRARKLTVQTIDREGQIEMKWENNISVEGGARRTANKYAWASPPANWKTKKIIVMRSPPGPRFFSNNFKLVVTTR